MAKMKAVLMVAACVVMTACGGSGGSAGHGGVAGNAGTSGNLNGGEVTPDGIDAINLTAPIDGKFWVKGTLSGYVGEGLVLEMNGEELAIERGSNAIKFATPIAEGQDYKINVKSGGAAPTQDCLATFGASGVGGTSMPNVGVMCTYGVRYLFSSMDYESGFVAHRWTGDQSMLFPSYSIGGADAGGYSATFARNPQMSVLYTASSATLSSFKVDELTGALSRTAQLSQSIGAFGRELLVHPNGKMMYVATGNNSITEYHIDGTGAPYQGKTNYLGSYMSVIQGIAMNVGGFTSTRGTIHAWSIDGKLVTLTLDVNGEVQAVSPQPSPSARISKIAFDPAGKFAYSANNNLQTLSEYQVSATGQLSLVKTINVYDGVNLDDIAIDPYGGMLYTIGNSFTGVIHSVHRRWSIHRADGYLTENGTFDRPGRGSIATIHPINGDLFLMEDRQARRIVQARNSLWVSGAPTTLASPTGLVGLLLY